MLILDLPSEVLETILNCLSYDEVSHCRLVCQKFNEISKIVLNRGFLNVEKFNMHCLKSVESQLPRRPSKRYRHSLAIHFSILTEIKLRLSLLSFTYRKYIESNECCFIPGKVLDEIFQALRYLSLQTRISRSDYYNNFREMRDLSSMAREHFKKKIAPGLDKKQEEKKHFNINECLQGRGPCALGAMCANSPGGFKCSCPVGMDGDPYNQGCRQMRQECRRDEDYKSIEACNRLTVEYYEVCNRSGIYGKGALCTVANHHHDCYCHPGITGNPCIECSIPSVKHLRPNSFPDFSMKTPSQTCKLPSLLDELSKKYDSVMSELTSLKIKKKELRKVEKRITDLEQFAADCKKKLGETEKTIAEQQATIYQQDMKLSDQELKIKKLTKLVEEMQEAGNVGTACKNSTTGTGRGQNGGRETAIVTRATKRKLRQNVSDKTSTRGRKKSRRSLNS